MKSEGPNLTRELLRALVMYQGPAPVGSDLRRSALAKGEIKGERDRGLN